MRQTSWTFQFQNGAIKSFLISQFGKLLFVCFNSKMVRLKAEFTQYLHDKNISFQFQNGAIKSHAVSLVSRPINGFNSKMVRLKGAAGLFWHTGNVNVSIPKWCD